MSTTTRAQEKVAYTECQGFFYTLTTYTHTDSSNNVGHVYVPLLFRGKECDKFSSMATIRGKYINRLGHEAIERLDNRSFTEQDSFNAQAAFTKQMFLDRAVFIRGLSWYLLLFFSLQMHDPNK